MLSKPSLDQLINRCKAADPKAQMALYDQYASAMYRVAFKIIGQTDEAEDAVQESMLSAFNSLDQFRGEVTFGAWLKKIVINKSIRLKQKQHRVLWKDPPQEFTTDHETSVYIDDDQELDYVSSSVKRVEQVLTKLPVQQSTIVKLYYYEGLEHAEIANYLDISEANCRTSLSRAKETMRKLLKL
ncbi:MAG: hypothetical protein RLZZ593_518 [Bacteroidota bacterium]